MLVLAGMRPLCSWFLIMDAISSLEVVPFHFHNLCRNTCWQRQSRCLAVPPAVRQGVHAKLLGGAAWAGGTSTTCLANPALNWQDHLVALLLCKCQALQSHFHQLRKLLFLSILLIHAPDKLSSLKKCPGPWLCRSFQLIEAAGVKSPPKVRLCF